MGDGTDQARPNSGCPGRAGRRRHGPKAPTQQREVAGRWLATLLIGGAAPSGAGAPGGRPVVTPVGSGRAVAPARGCRCGRPFPWRHRPAGRAAGAGHDVRGAPLHAPGPLGSRRVGRARRLGTGRPVPAGPRGAAGRPHRHGPPRRRPRRGHPAGRHPEDAAAAAGGEDPEDPAGGEDPGEHATATDAGQDAAAGAPHRDGRRRRTPHRPDQGTAEAGRARARRRSYPRAQDDTGAQAA